ncbi:MAG: type I glyceraldehyde-3-phosphate dehydrogenase [Candidatus Bathyarchaeia archaeon]
MPIRVAINGFGRIGRLVYRAVLEEKAKVAVIAVNDLTKAETLAHLLKHDTVHGKLPFSVEAEGDRIIVEGKELKVLSEPDPAKLPWKELGVHTVVESTGRFRDRKNASKHLEAGARKVLISAPSSDPDVTIVPGVNDGEYDPESHRIISLASCTTNCISPVAKVLDDYFGVEAGLMNTIHAYTNDQRLLDMQHSDLRRARAAATNIVVTTTGAARAAGVVISKLAGRLNGLALRVPVPNVSIVDLTAKLSRPVTVEEVNKAYREAAEGSLKGILAYTEEPLVSSDFIHNPYSAIVDGLSTMVIGDLVKVLAWYDNEWGYSCRMVEMLEKIGEAEAI